MIFTVRTEHAIPRLYVCFQTWNDRHDFENLHFWWLWS